MLLVGAIISVPVYAQNTEAEYSKQFCNSIGGKTETRHYYTYGEGRTSYVLVDCETATHVFECGLDKRSSLDSVQQALFAAHLTNKLPAVVIYDTDDQEGQIEHRIRVVAETAGIHFVTINLKQERGHSNGR